MLDAVSCHAQGANVMSLILCGAGVLFLQFLLLLLLLLKLLLLLLLVLLLVLVLLLLLLLLLIRILLLILMIMGVARAGNECLEAVLWYCCFMQEAA